MSSEPYPVIRGGCWNLDPARARVASRDGIEPSYRLRYLGFRLARVRSPLERLAEVGREVSNEK